MPYELRNTRTLFTGNRIRLDLLQLVDEARDKTTTREVVVHPGAVVILPFATGGDQPTPQDQILLIRNHRQSVNKQLIELPAGTLEQGEAPMNCAGRELQEETGHLARRLAPIGSFYASPGVLTEKLHAFAAFNLMTTQTNLDDGEEIELLPTTFSEALDMIRQGQIEDAKTIATLLMYRLLNF